MNPKFHPYQVVKLFEDCIADYTKAPVAVSCDSCTSALLLCALYHNVVNKEVTFPRKTYLSPLQSVMHAGGIPVLENDYTWSGYYQLKPFPIWDSAKAFRSGLYKEICDKANNSNQFVCLSFHQRKTLNIGKGGMILCNDEKAADWFKLMRYEGRSTGYGYHFDNISLCGYNFYLTPGEACRGLELMQYMPEYNADMPEDPPYINLDSYDLFKNCKVI